nr:MAG TPA: hypothetical protein [Herelleviridae sp.]
MNRGFKGDLPLLNHEYRAHGLAVISGMARMLDLLI